MGTSKFDIADYLDSKEMIAEYLNTVLEEGDNTDVINAIGHVAKAIGMTKISEATGLSRPSLYKASICDDNEGFESNWRTNSGKSNISQISYRLQSSMVSVKG